MKISEWGLYMVDMDREFRSYYQRIKVTVNQLHSWIMKAVASHTESIINKDTCVRVNYSAGYQK